MGHIQALSKEWRKRTHRFTFPHKNDGAPTVCHSPPPPSPPIIKVTLCLIWSQHLFFSCDSACNIKLLLAIGSSIHWDRSSSGWKQCGHEAFQSVCQWVSDQNGAYRQMIGFEGRLHVSFERGLPVCFLPSSPPWQCPVHFVEGFIFCWKCRKFRQLFWNPPKTSTNKIHMLLLRKLKINDLKLFNCINSLSKGKRKFI